MDANKDSDSPRGDYSGSRPPSWNTQSAFFKSDKINNQDMNDFRNFRNYRTPRFFDWSTLYMSEQSGSIEKSSIQLTIVHSVTTAGLLPPSRKLTVIKWASVWIVGIHPVN